MVGAEFQWVLQVGRGKSIVHQHLRVALNLGHRGNIGDIERRIGGRFQPDKLGILLDRGRNRSGITGVHDGHFHAPLSEIIEQAVGTTVGIIAQNDVISWAHQDADQGIGSGHAGRKHARILRAFQCR